jgi:methanogenic corrinoid protein MtbC1
MAESASRSFPAEESYKRYLEGLLAGDRQQCSAVFQEWIESDKPLGELYLKLVQRSLYEVGELWERGKVSVATEHLAAAITENLLNFALSRQFVSSRSGKSVVVACVPNEYHQIGARLVADHFELNGWRSLFLGANTPTRALLSLIAEKRPDMIALSATMTFNLDALIKQATEIRAAVPEVPILVGGQAFREVGRERVESLPGLRFLKSLEDLEEPWTGMFDGGYRLKLARLDRSLTCREVERLSRVLSKRFADERYTVRISVLAAIENEHAIPSIFRMASLCLIYEIDLPIVLKWFGVRQRETGACARRAAQVV